MNITRQEAAEFLRLKKLADAVMSPARASGCGAAPHRICLSRKKGFRLPRNAVVVSRPSGWGNPFVVGPERSQAQAVASFRTWLTVDGITADIPERKQWMLDHLHELRGRILACWCKKGTPCHADVLLELANNGRPTLEMREAQLATFRDAVLNERCQMEEGTLGPDQINQVLALFDDVFGVIGNEHHNH